MDVSSPTAPRAGAAIPADWARALVDPKAFRREQARLEHVWTFLGLAQDVAKDGDWFTASLATRSVFVQRFGSELKGFENLCAHRFYPLRQADKGNGPIVCGFHGWRYDSEGRALGIPLCTEAFGAVSRQLDARLRPIQVAVCGSLVFGRFPASHATDTLEAFLGDGFPVLAAMSRMSGEPRLATSTIEANWRLCLHISLDDYHAAVVHPTTLGKGGYIHRKDMTYVRFGLHSAFLLTSAPQSFEKMSAACRDGTFRSTHYSILQVLPNLVMAHLRTVGQFHICVLQHFDPIAPGRTASRSWVYPAPFPADHGWLARLTGRLTEPIRSRLVFARARAVFREDAVVCEKLQQVADQVDGSPMIGALEERIGWFEDSYRRLVFGS